VLIEAAPVTVGDRIENVPDCALADVLPAPPAVTERMLKDADTGLTERFAPAWIVGAGIENEALTDAGEICALPVAVGVRTVNEAD
jgi:hypothetical protein